MREKMEGIRSHGTISFVTTSRRHLTILLALQTLVGTFAPTLTRAAELPFSIRQAIVKVYCGDRQGSGVVVNGAAGYVLTNAHIVLNDLVTQTEARSCVVGFLEHDATTTPTVFYSATRERVVYDESQNRDFAVLKLGSPTSAKKISTIPFIKTDEFSRVGDPLTIAGYPGGASKGRFTVTNGSISGLEGGIIKTQDAVISPGASGGAGLDAQNNLIGLATRILLREISTGVEEVVDYELVDIRAILNWMDTFGTNMHDQYVTHADALRYHGPSTFFIEGKLSCTLLARSSINTTVYCLRSDGTRDLFPNDAVYYSWFSDFSGVLTLKPEELAPYRLRANITMKPGSLIKVQTDPKVYLVSDDQGTLRWIETETRARELYGDGWAGFVKDVPDTFFTNYHVGPSIQ
jgi:hypothetical protein